MSDALPEILGRRLSREVTTLRAWPLVLTGAAGLALLVLHVVFELGKHPPRLSGLVLNLGTGLLLFSLLLVVQVKLVQRAVSVGRAVTADEFASTFTEPGVNPLTPGDFYEETGPFVVAAAAVLALAGGNVRQAWSLCDANFRRCRAMAWLYNNREELDLPAELNPDTESLIQLLTDLNEAPNGLTEAFIESESGQYSAGLHDFDADRWGWSQRRRIVGPGHEMLLALPLPVDAPHGLVVDRPTVVPHTIKVLVSCAVVGDRTTYLVAGVNYEAAPLPTWPPTWWAIDDPASVAAHPGVVGTA